MPKWEKGSGRILKLMPISINLKHGFYCGFSMRFSGPQLTMTPAPARSKLTFVYYPTAFFCFELSQTDSQVNPFFYVRQACLFLGIKLSINPQGNPTASCHLAANPPAIQAPPNVAYSASCKNNCMRRNDADPTLLTD